MSSNGRRNRLKGSNHTAASSHGIIASKTAAEAQPSDCATGEASGMANKTPVRCKSTQAFPAIKRSIAYQWASAALARGKVAQMAAMHHSQPCANGDVTAGFAKMAEQSRIKTSLGSIHATVNPSEAFSLQAAASFGKILAKVDVAAVKGGNGRSKLRGTYQGGGPLLDLKASSGNVIIEAGEPLFAL